MSKFEKCDFRGATHIMLADGTVRAIRLSKGGIYAFLDDEPDKYIVVGSAEAFGCTFVREVVPPTPEPEVWDVNIPPSTCYHAIYLPSRFFGHKVRVTVEVVK